MQNLILFGYIAKAVGLKGCVKLKLLNFESEVLDAGLTVYLRHGKQEPKSYVIKSVESNDRIFFQEIHDRTEAEKMQGSEIYVERDALPALENNEYYLHDLVGAQVFLRSGESVGQVDGFSDNGAQTLLEVKTHANKTVSIPLVPAIVVSIDEDQRRIIIDPPEGLLELE